VPSIKEQYVSETKLILFESDADSPIDAFRAIVAHLEKLIRNDPKRFTFRIWGTSDSPVVSVETHHDVTDVYPKARYVGQEEAT
jgi:hypothetical protein